MFNSNNKETRENTFKSIVDQPYGLDLLNPKRDNLTSLYAEGVEDLMPSSGPYLRDGAWMKDKKANAKQASGERFNPYEDNSGTSLSIRNNDFIVVAADTRHSSEMGINSRTSSKIFKIKNFLMTVTNFYGDGLELFNILSYEVELYEAISPISIHALACLTSKLMYSRRFFPFYTYVTLSGFDNGKPYVYRYDPVGGYEEVRVICNGSGAPLIQPLLDSFIDLKNWHGDKPVVDRDYTLRIVYKAFDAASERDVKTGDFLEVYVMTKDEIVREVTPLRKD